MPLTCARYSGIPAKVNETRRFCVTAPRTRTLPAEDWLTRSSQSSRRWGAERSDGVAGAPSRVDRSPGGSRGVGSLAFALVAETGQSLQRIVDQVTEINRVVAEIAAGANEQATAVASVNQSIGDKDKATQQDAAMAEESTAASHNLSDEAKHLAALIAEFEVAQTVNGKTPRPARDAMAPLRKAG